MRVGRRLHMSVGTEFPVSSPGTPSAPAPGVIRVAVVACLALSLASCAPVHLVCVPDSVYTSDVCQRAVRGGAR